MIKTFQRPSSPRRSQRGFTFAELSFVIIVSGLVTALVAQVIPALRRASSTAETVRNLSATQASLESFAAIHARLPCADTDDDGLENASPCQTIGKLPYRTLGLSAPLLNGEGFDFKYALYQRGNADVAQDAALGVRTERYQPAIGQEDGGSVVLKSKSYSTSGGAGYTSNRRLDFCQGLRAGLDGSFSANHLHVDFSGNRKNVAYVLVDPGLGNMDLSGDLFDGNNGSATAAAPRFDHPNRQQSMTYDDRVVVAYFDQFWEILSCSGAMATAGRSHPNVETTAALFRQGMADYDTQMDIAVDAAFADNFSAGAGVALAATGVASSGASLVIDIASNINKSGATAGATVSAGLSLGLNIAAAVVAGVNLALTVTNYNDMKDLHTRFKDLRNNRLQPLYESLQRSVSRSGELIYSDQ